MRIVDVIFAPGVGAFYNDDLVAVRHGAARDGYFYIGRPITEGFADIRAPAAALGIGLVLTDGSVCWGDIMTVQYAGVGGREQPLDPTLMQDRLQRELVPFLIGLDVTSFRDVIGLLSKGCNAFGRLPNSARYGLTQALLYATAVSARATMAEIICAEYGFPLVTQPVPILCQSGEDRHQGVDKMILRYADVLPHGLINRMELIGLEGSTLADYVTWVRDRVLRFGSADYRPTLHFDVYGGIGRAVDHDIGRIVALLGRLGACAAPFALRIESPADFGSREAQMCGLAEIRLALRKSGSAVQIVADEWCNTLPDVEDFVMHDAADLIQLKMPDMGSLDETIQAVQICRDGGIGVYLGGSCTETDQSARTSVHIAVATQAAVMLAKPGMGVDEGHAIVSNEQSRLLSMLERPVRSGDDHRPMA